MCVSFACCYLGVRSAWLISVAVYICNPNFRGHNYVFKTCSLSEIVCVLLAPKNDLGSWASFCDARSTSLITAPQDRIKQSLFSFLSHWVYQLIQYTYCTVVLLYIMLPSHVCYMEHGMLRRHKKIWTEIAYSGPTYYQAMIKVKRDLILVNTFSTNYNLIS